MTREQIKSIVDQGMEQLLGNIYALENVQSGDIMPDQYLRWKKLLEDTADLFEELLEQNK